MATREYEPYTGPPEDIGTPNRVIAAYLGGVVLIGAGIVLGVIGVNDHQNSTVFSCSNGASLCTRLSGVDAGLFWSGVGLVWLGLAVLVAGYGRRHHRPFFPLFIAGLFIPFPVCLLAIAVTSTVPERKEA